jgi:hypothetical protein
MRRLIWGLVFAAASVTSACADELRPPLEKQFFDYFVGRCTGGMNAEVAASGKDPNDSRVVKFIEQYCGCTSQAIVSYLSAEEIISFANDPEKEPASSKMRPYFAEKCKGK